MTQMDHDNQQQVKKLAGFLSRNLRLILICWLCSLLAGLAIYLKSPKLYQSTALIMYQQQQINPTKMSPDVQTRILEMVNTMSQQVTSRSSLEEIIKTHDLYPELRQNLPMEDVVAIMRDKHISIKPGKGDIFEVSFAASDPRKVMRVANALASKFIEENIRFREQRVTETSAYIKDELTIAKASLDKQEEGMRDYKLKYYNEMPEQRAANIARLNALQDQYQNIQNNLQELARTKILIQEQISFREDILVQLSSVPGGNLPPENPSAELALVRQELKTLQGKYTPNHPDVKRLQNQLNNLLEAQEEGGTQEDPSAEKQSAISELDPYQHDKQLAQLRLQLKEIDLDTARLIQEQNTIRKQVELVQQWVEATPVREAEWARLTRDYSQLQEHYQTLVSRSLEAESAESLEKRQKGSQFQIIEPAHFPEKPFQPNFSKFMTKAALFGLGLGLALAYGLGFMNTSFKDLKELESYLGVPVICAIPALPTVREKSRQKLRNVLWRVSLVSAFVLLGGGMLLLWHKGLIII